MILTVARLGRCSQRLVGEKAQHWVDFFCKLYHLICRHMKAAQDRWPDELENGNKRESSRVAVSLGNLRETLELIQLLPGPWVALKFQQLVARPHTTSWIVSRSSGYRCVTTAAHATLIPICPRCEELNKIGGKTERRSLDRGC